MSPSMSDYRKRQRDMARMRWIKEQPCCAGLDPAMVELAGPCQGEVEADHVRDMSGMGRKSEDDQCIPLCSRHHREPGLEALCFGRTEKGYAKAWKLEHVGVYRAAYEHHLRGGDK